MKCRLPKTTKKQDKIIHDAVKEEMDKQLEKINRDMVVQMLYVLHFDFGFGNERLTRFAKALNECHDMLRERYELADDEIPFLCEDQLRKSGVDFDSLVGE